jgi:hypothetical protein
MSIRKAFAVVACTMLTFSVALAADAPPRKDRVCADDAKKFCSTVKPGGGRLYQCLTSHNAELAPACRDGIAAAKARYDQFVQACSADAEKYCKSIPPGHGRILSCLKGRESDLTPVCRAEYNRSKNDPTVTQ